MNKPYSYRVQTKRGDWEIFSGTFMTIEKAETWYLSHGKFFEKKGHILALFDRGKKTTLEIEKEILKSQ